MTSSPLTRRAKSATTSRCRACSCRGIVRPGERHSAAAVRHPNTLIEWDVRHEEFYTPFEHVNGNADEACQCRRSPIGLRPSRATFLLSPSRGIPS